MKVALDTNVLAYAEGTNGAAIRNQSTGTGRQTPHASVVLPVQTLGELFQVLVRKAGCSPEDARSAISPLLLSRHALLEAMLTGAH